MAKNNQKKEKALRNKEYARKYRKKTPFGRGRGRAGGGRPAGPGPGPSTAAPTAVAPVSAP